nr:hypothetical protein BaRGS_027057 [Batillaria attramentaria]
MGTGASKKNERENASVGDIYSANAEAVISERRGRESTSLSQPRGEEGAYQNQPVSVHDQENDTTTAHKDDANSENEGQYGEGETIEKMGDEADEEQEEENLEGHDQENDTTTAHKDDANSENEGQYGGGETIEKMGDEADEEQEEEKLEGEREREKKETDDDEEEKENDDSDDLLLDSSDDSDSDSSKSDSEMLRYIKDDKLLEVLVAERGDVSTFFTQTSTIVQKNDNGLYTKEFIEHVNEIATLHANGSIKKIPVKVQRKFLNKIGEDLVESGSVPILCQVVADQLKSESESYLSEEEETRRTHRRMVYAALSSVWNFTDAILVVTKAVKEHGVLVPVLLSKLSEWRPQYLDGTLNGFISKFLLNGCLSILHNMAMQEENVEYLRDLKTSEVLWDYLLATDDDIRLTSLATLADISTDTESGRLATSSDQVKFVLELLGKALNRRDHTYNGWSGTEIVRAVRQLARNDVNKKLLVDDGVLPLLVQGADSDLEDEKVESIEALWRLSFSKDNKARFVENEELMDLVRKVFYDRKEKDSCRVAAQGILWQVRYELERKEKSQYWEAEYAADRKKRIIPLIMQPGYEPDGWLGMIKAGKFYYDFSGGIPFEEMFQKLLIEIQEPVVVVTN